MIHEEVKKTFNPEFLNRLDEVILFDSLTDSDLEQIVDLLIVQVNDVLRHKKFSIVVRPEVRKWIVDKTCRDRSYGARPLRRAIQRYLEDPLSEALIRNRLEPDVTLEIYLEGDTLCYLPAGSPAESGMRLSV
jgi:ATP-dependent Clp protease ATP-binding subunit ClpC